MRRFLLNTIVFLIVAFVAIAIFHIILLRPRNEMLRLDDDIRFVFLGNSTFEYGINDKLIPHSKNFAQNAETADLVYAKLRMLKNANPNLDTAYVEFDDIILFNVEMPSVLAHPFFLTEFDAKDVRANIMNMSFERNTSYFGHIYDIIKIRPLIAGNFGNTDITKLGIGGYADLYRDKLYEDIEKSKSHVSDKQSEVPEQNLYYFKAIRDYCKKKGIKLIFLSTPVHKTAWNDTIYRRLHSDEFYDIPMIDCTHMNLPDSCFADRYHLNYRGAGIYSDSLRRIMRSRDFE